MTRTGRRVRRTGRRGTRTGRRDWALAGGLAAGVALDALIGDPRRGHPVAAFGRGAAKLETRMYADDRFRGALYTTACVLSAALPAVAADRLTRHRPLLRGAAVAAVVGGHRRPFAHPGSRTGRNSAGHG